MCIKTNATKKVTIEKSILYKIYNIQQLICQVLFHFFTITNSNAYFTIDNILNLRVR